MERRTIDCIQVTLTSYTVALIPSKATFKKNDAIPSELIHQKADILNSSPAALKKYPGSEKFINKASVAMNSSCFDDDDYEESASPDARTEFSSALETDFIRRLTFKNLSSSSQIVVVRF